MGAKQSLHSAAKTGKLEEVRSIIKEAKEKSFPLNLEATDSDGYTALHLAAMGGHLDIVRLLQTNGVSLTTKYVRKDGAEGETALQLAFYHGGKKQFSVARYLMIECELPLERRRDYAMTILGWACASNQVEIAQRLWSEGEELDEVDSSGLECTALHYACMNDHLPTTKLLVAKGANLEIRDLFGATPFYRAAARNASKEVLQFLLDAGSDINARGKWNETPLELALASDRADMVEWLSTHGAHPADPIVVQAMKYYDFDYY